MQTLERVNVEFRWQSFVPFWIASAASCLVFFSRAELFARTFGGAICFPPQEKEKAWVFWLAVFLVGKEWLFCSLLFICYRWNGEKGSGLVRVLENRDWKWKRVSRWNSAEVIWMYRWGRDLLRRDNSANPVIDYLSHRGVSGRKQSAAWIHLTSFVFANTIIDAATTGYQILHTQSPIATRG